LAGDPTAGAVSLRHLTTFVGRRKELAELQERLKESRLLTLAGPGGCGKTRLALELANRVRARFPDGAWPVELAAVAEQSLVAHAVAAALGVQ
jgi:predicted ATPase